VSNFLKKLLTERNKHPKKEETTYQRFRQAKFPDGGLVLALSQFSLLPQLPPKILLDSKVVNIDPNIIISLC
jgi:hypothetical protein